MDGLTLLREACDAGLTVAPAGDRLLIRGPRRLENYAQRLIAHKPEVMRALYRERAKALLLPILRADPALAAALRDLWAERLAVVAADPDCAAHAERVAWEGLHAAAGGAA